MDRAGSDVPTATTNWDNWDTKLLDRIDVKYGTTLVRRYDLNYQVISHTDGSPSVTWQTTVLDSVATIGGTTTAPTITFTYIKKDNRAVQNSTSNEWAYPRLETINNGWGSVATFLYENDGRLYTSWYNWHVNDFRITDSVNSGPIKSLFAYSKPCYDDDTAGHCNASEIGSLVGYAQTIATTKAFNGTTTLAITVHKFHTDEQRLGREYETQVQDSAGTILSQTNTTFSVYAYSAVPGGYFAWVTLEDRFLRLNNVLTRVERTDYSYEGIADNVVFEQHYQCMGIACTPHTETTYTYANNMNPSVWILDAISDKYVAGNSGSISSEEFGYDGNLPGAGPATTNKPTLRRIVDVTQTIEQRTYMMTMEISSKRACSRTTARPAASHRAHTSAH